MNLLKIPTSYYELQLANQSGYGNERLEKAVKMAADLFEAGSSVLDVGCADGSNLKLWEKTGLTAQGYDLRSDISNTIQGDMHQMEDQFGKWDYVFSSHTLEHAFDYDYVLNQFKLVAKKGIFIVVPIENTKVFKATEKHPVKVTTWGVVKHFGIYWKVWFMHRKAPGKELVLYAERL